MQYVMYLCNAMHTCQYFDEHRSTQLFSPTFRSDSLYLLDGVNHAVSQHVAVRFSHGQRLKIKVKGRQPLCGFRGTCRAHVPLVDALVMAGLHHPAAKLQRDGSAAAVDK